MTTGPDITRRVPLTINIEKSDDCEHLKDTSPIEGVIFVRRMMMPAIAEDPELFLVLVSSRDQRFGQLDEHIFLMGSFPTQASADWWIENGGDPCSRYMEGRLRRAVHVKADSDAEFSKAHRN